MDLANNAHESSDARERFFLENAGLHLARATGPRELTGEK